MRRMKMIMGALIVVVAAVPVLAMVVWTTFRIEVGPNECAVLTRKMGDRLPEGQMLATKPGQQGIQEEVLGPGRYFRNPLFWDSEKHGLTVIPSGDPKTWDWAKPEQTKPGSGTSPPFRGEVPQIGVVTRRVGPKPPSGQVIVDRSSGYQGVLREVLTPGTYKLNPYVYDVEIVPAVVIPAGFVGVVTNQFGEEQATPPAPAVIPPAESEPAAGDMEISGSGPSLAEPGQRGTLCNVLQPGVYFINPKLQKIMQVEIGFNEYSQVKVSESENLRISFPSDTGYDILVGVTVVWGIDPAHAAEIVSTYGNVDAVLDKIIEPQLRSICRNIGSTYAARDFIQGEKREQFQRAMTAELQRVCRAKNIEILLALVREIEVHAPQAGDEGGEVTEDLKRTIQQSYIAIEKQITKEKQREAAMVKAELEEVRKLVDIARETVAAETRVMVANIKAEGEKKAAETDATAALDVATIQEQVAQLDAQRIEILGKARTDVEKLKKEAEAEGYRMLVDAFGSPRAFNLYTFAENFQPEEIRLFFAGVGTFWTDLSRFEEVGAARILQEDKPDERK